MKKKCPECSGFGIGVYDNEVGFCRNCDGTGEIIVKWSLRRLRWSDDSLVTRAQANEYWMLESPTGEITFHFSHAYGIAAISFYNRVVA